MAKSNFGLANQPQIQNARVKAISSLPCDYTKDELGGFLRNPYYNERNIRQVSEALRWTVYPYFKLTKTYADIPTYRNYFKPLHVTAEDIKTNEFKREARLLDKFSKEFAPKMRAHEAVAKAGILGKVFFVPRYQVDKTHNKVVYAFWQQLPSDYCEIIGENNISGKTVSFNMMYFMQAGTDVNTYGDLFKPYLDDFDRMFKEAPKQKYVYASHPEVSCKGRKLNFFPENINGSGFGNPKVFMQDGTWEYWVSLPIDKVWCFELDDASPAVASPFAGLMLTYAQQADYEAAQLSLLLNPLIKIFTGEIPYFDGNGTNTADDYRLSPSGRLMFEAFFDALMARNNTGGAAFFSAPVENIKSHDFSESANANDISTSFNKYASGKAGLSALIPVADDIKAAQVDASKKIEARFATATIYPQFERMMRYIYRTLNLNYEWEFVMFGDIFSDGDTRDVAYKAISNGDISSHFILSALDDESWLDKLAMMETIKESGLLDMLIPPITSYTMKQDTNGGLPPQSGRPKTTDMSESKETSIDQGFSEV
ncbi:MAG: hypothetical protein IKU30_00965 [Clostridia bacterium]|nr:hypothetical protein [Clostridia bacterium]